MARVQIYHSMIYPVKDDDDFPMLYLPVEIPDVILADYEAAVAHERALRDQIIKTYGESPINPQYDQDWEDFVRKTTDEADEEFDTPVSQAEWAEYE